MAPINFSVLTDEQIKMLVALLDAEGELAKMHRITAISTITIKRAADGGNVMPDTKKKIAKYLDKISP